MLAWTLRFVGSPGFWEIVQMATGTAFVSGACGFFVNKPWGRICVGCLMGIVILWAADMLLFIAWRGLGAGRGWILSAAVVLSLAAISTWLLLAATRPGFYEP